MSSSFLKRRDFLKLSLIQSVVAGFSHPALAAPKKQIQVRQRGPSVLQGATDDQQTQFTVVHDRNETYNFKAIGSKGKTLFPQTVSVSDLDEQQQTVISRVHFSGLNSEEIYSLQMLDTKTDALLQEREFKTLNLNKKNIRFAICSCMDDTRHEPEIWLDLLSNNPDVIFFIGDSVYCDKGKTAELVPDPERLWRRFSEARNTLEIYHSKKLIPILATWDDHDFGQDNSGMSYPFVKESQDNFLNFYAQDPDKCRWLQRGPGISSAFTLQSHLFLLMDDRSYRFDGDSLNRYAHWGQEQEQWALQLIENHEGPAWVMNGSQIFSTAVLKESMAGQHPEQFKGFMQEIRKINNRVMFASGDVHFSEVSKIEREFLGYETYEVTSSSIHSFKLPGLPGIINNPRRIASTGRKNYVIVDSIANGTGALMKVQSCSPGKVNFDLTLKTG